jgi:hypothetical protein
VTAGRVRAAAIGGGAALLLGLWVAPSLPPAVLLPLSAAWLALLAALLVIAARVAALRFGRRTGPVLVGLLALAPILVTAVPWPPALGVWLPCRRNWSWLPSWLLRASPTRSVRFQVGAARVKLCWGAPAARGRRMIGGPAVPFGRLWRTGANEPTTILTTAPLDVAGTRVGRRASIYTIPGPESWEIILNGSTTHWGLESEYTDRVRARELGRSVVASRQSRTHVERLTIEPLRRPADTVLLGLRWEAAEVDIPITPAP